MAPPAPTYSRRRCSLLVFAYEQRLILEVETRPRPVGAEERPIAIVADDEPGGSLHSGGMTLVSRTAFRTQTADVATPRGPGTARLKLRPAVRRAILTAHII